MSNELVDLEFSLTFENPKFAHSTEQQLGLQGFGVLLTHDSGFAHYSLVARRSCDARSPQLDRVCEAVIRAAHESGARYEGWSIAEKTEN